MTKYPYFDTYRRITTHIYSRDATNYYLAWPDVTGLTTKESNRLIPGNLSFTNITVARTKTNNTQIA